MSRTVVFSSAIAARIVEYVAYMRALGRQFSLPSTLLAELDHFLVARGAADLTSESFSDWRASLDRVSSNGQLLRLQIVRRFCLWRQRTEPTCFAPDPAHFPRHQPAPSPHVLSEEDISRLLRAAGSPRPGASPLCRQVMRLAVVLLYTTGLRRGELLRLNMEDYDASDGLLRVRETKFYKSRIVPLSPDATGEVERFCIWRKRCGLPCGADAPLMLLRRDGEFRRYKGDAFGNSMRRLFLAAGIRTARGRAPRTHDLRFTFAAHALSRWYRAGADVQTCLPALATYMGHASVASTQYYLSSLQVVEQEASERFDRYCSRFLPGEGGDR